MLRALADGPRLREQLDRAAGRSNSPDDVLHLRRLFGLEIPCDRVAGVDRDGRPCAQGMYRLTDADRAKVIELLGVA